MTAQKVLVIDDSRQERYRLNSVLRRAGYLTIMADSGEAGLRQFFSENPELVILDISMPGMDGWEVCQRIRQVSEVPILILSAAHDSIADKVRGLDLGANDYMVKPFHHEELLARVRTNLRISPRLTQRNQYEDAFLSINLIERTIERDGKSIDLTEKEFGLLKALLRGAPDPVTIESLFDQVWGYPETYDANYVRIYMSSLRRKLEPNPKKPAYIQTVRGIGYRFVSADSFGENGVGPDR